MDMLLSLLGVGVIGIIAIIITYVITKRILSLEVNELEARNEILETQHIEVGQQLSELMKLKERADERLFNLDKYLTLAVSEKEMTYQQITKLERQIEHERDLKAQLELRIQEAGKLQTKAETELSEAKKIIAYYQNKSKDFTGEIDGFTGR
jgi:hypothetical protein